MTDKEIVVALLNHNESVTKDFFFCKCRPLFLSLMGQLFSYKVEYDEFVSEIYQYLMADDGAKLRMFAFESSIYQWLKVVTIRYFLPKRDRLIENTSKESPYDSNIDEGSDKATRSLENRIDLLKLLSLMPNKRNALVIQRLIIDDATYEDVAAELNVTVDNLYNIKKRAMSSLTDIAIKYYNYGR